MAIAIRSNGQISYPFLSAGAFTAALAVRETGPAGAPKPRLLDRVREAMGLRLLECCHLRVKDVDFATNQIVIRDGKGRKDRVTMLPAAVKTALITHLERAREHTKPTFATAPAGSSCPTP